MKEISISVLSGLMVLCLSAGLYAQSSEQELDQVELMKQFIGDWKADLGNDTVIYWHFSPYEKGYLHSGKYQTKGETFSSWQGIIGFGGNEGKFKNIHMFWLWEGRITGDFGQFKSEDKLVMNRFNANRQVNFAKWECTFLTPDKAKIVNTSRKWSAENWDNAEVTEFNWERVNK